MKPIDHEARSRAVDPERSVCVSAPAGSGKTALLVLRLLVLLARVEAPEHVVAITFTRKAAAEMRARVLDALERGAAGEAGGSPHEAELLRAAAAVVARDRAKNWGLAENPSRLSIQTIDSFCGELTRQMPVLSGVGGAIATTDDADRLYEEAIRRSLEDGLASAASRADLEALLLHLDNRWDSAVDLLRSLLARREQWQPLLGASGLAEDQLPLLQAARRDLIAYRIERLREDLQPFLPRIVTLSNWRSAQLEGIAEFSPREAKLPAWQDLASLLLTAKGEWRRSVTVKQGFPPGKGRPADEKAAMIELLGDLAASDGQGELRRALADLLLLPDPESDVDEHAAILAALTRLLPRLAAQLLLVFRERGVVDHAQIALAALGALGSDDAPTDLSLRLDYRIEHLLVDEFQDTSSLQFELLRRLTRGWVEHNAMQAAVPRTLLIVGDPMQSIYGFREANVGLFIRARDEGVGELRLDRLELKVNFRSQAQLVAWNNLRFERAFPMRDDPELGAVSFARAEAARAARGEPVLHLFTSEDRDAARGAEVEALCDAVESELAGHAGSSLALLGRSRAQLRPFLAELRKRGLSFAARDLDPLMQRQPIRDLVSLLRVLVDPCDRFAWFSLLRTPAIALNNADLLRLAELAPLPPLRGEGLDSRYRETLSDDGRERLQHAEAVLLWAEHYRDRLALRVWVEECWLRLGIDGAIASAADAEDVEQFFRLLERLEQEPGGLSRSALEAGLDKLYASPGDDRSRLQVMTLHKAKGLEFDAVFIPALGQTTRSEQAPLLLWEELNLPRGGGGLLIDIRDAVGASSGPRLHDFLHRQRAQKRALEATRLFYVGCTRAVDRLWLSGTLPWNAKDASHGPPSAASLLASLWPSIEDRVVVSQVAPAARELTATVPYRRICRLPAAPQVPRHATAQRGALRALSASAAANSRASRVLGTAVHRVLESLVYRESIPSACDAPMRSLLRAELLDAGMDRPGFEDACRRGEAMLESLLRDPWLRRALDPQRPLRRAEFALARSTEEASESLVVDYLFDDEVSGERWVVDYKTSRPREDETLEQFLATQAEQYQSQLRAYSEALEALDGRPPRCALYFTALARHLEIAVVADERRRSPRPESSA
ncbi:MAG: UvrD-helicase domain-containing protein [Halieaceae bacterium]|nr:UvrD-helicase domain-containing protein [Halieaceae bacterium]